MAAAPAELRDRFLASEHRTYTAHTITDPGLIAHRLDDVARAGHDVHLVTYGSPLAPLYEDVMGLVLAPGADARGPAHRYPALGPHCFAQGG